MLGYQMLYNPLPCAALQLRGWYPCGDRDRWSRCAGRLL